MDNSINSFDYKPNFKFFKTGYENENKKLFVGFELEAESTGLLAPEDLAEGISSIVNDNGEQFIYFKHDGSLNYGIEVVSMPFTLDYIKENSSKIKTMLEYMKAEGYESHNPGTCGLHFHINKAFFGNTSEEIENNIDKLILFSEYYKDKLIAFSRRNDFEYCHFLGDKRCLSNEQRLNILKIKKEKYNVNRYMVVNTENTKTVEFRVIRGTLNYKTFMASVEFIFSLAKIIKNNKITDISWDDVINYEGNEYLLEYCNSKNITLDCKKMKDYSIEYLKQQNKMKADIKKYERDILIRTYKLLIKNTKQIPKEYSKLCDNIPEKFSGKINPNLLIDKYRKKNSLILTNQYLLDIIHCYDKTNCKLESFLNSINYCLNNVSRSNEIKRAIKNHDKEFLNFLSSKYETIKELKKKIEIDY